MSFCFRKKARVIGVKNFGSDKLKVLVNNKPIQYYHSSCLVSSFYKDVCVHLKGVYDIKLRGGGLSAQYELVQKVLYSYIQDSKLKSLIRNKYPFIDRTDERRNYPKKYGGRKARARTQKSYR